MANVVEIEGSLVGPDAVMKLPSAALADPPPRARPNRARRIEHPASDLYAGHDGFLVRTAIIRSDRFTSMRSAPQIMNGEAAAELCEHLAYSDQEHLVILALSSQMRLLAIHETAIGGASGVGQQPLHIIKVGVLVSSTRVIMVHNHPSGDPTPSREDELMTKAVEKALDCVGIILVDHVIVAADGHSSFRDLGLIE
jgi:DNA repair protein RadC